MSDEFFRKRRAQRNAREAFSEMAVCVVCLGARSQGSSLPRLQGGVTEPGDVAPDMLAGRPMLGKRRIRRPVGGLILREVV